MNLNVKSSSYKNKDKIERAALICAIEIGDLNTFKLLLSHHEIDVNESRLLNYDSKYEIIYNKEKMCPLAMTILSRNFEMFQLLCNHPGIDINQECEREFGNIQHCDFETCKYSPLFLTVDFQLNEYLKVILQNPKMDVNCHYSFKNRFTDSSCLKISAANFALKRKNKEMAHFIMKHPKYDINAISIQNNKEEHLLYLAYQSNDLDTFKLLLSMDNIDVNIVFKTSINPLKETTILQYALRQWKVEFIKTILEHPKTIVFLNINEEYDIKKVPKSLKKYKDKGDKETILQYAIEKGDIDIIRLILAHKNVDINLLSYKSTITKTLDKKQYKEHILSQISKKSALIMAFEKENIRIIKLLLN